MAKDEDLVALGYSQYWDQRYVAEQKIAGDGSATLGAYEWHLTFEALRPFYAQHLPPPPNDCHVLHLGCGNSTLTADFHDWGYTNQTSVDFSEVVIDAMKAKYASIDTRWSVMDVRALEIGDATIDFAIDKSTVDVMIHGSFWDPPTDVRENVGKYVDEVVRVLKPGGKWLYVTFRQPHFIEPLLTREKAWTLEVENVSDGTGFGYFGYIMTRHKIQNE